MDSTVVKLPAPLDTFGLKPATRFPLVALKAARCRRPAPSAESKSPPTYTLVPAGDTLSARTTPLALGFHDSRFPLAASNAASRLRVVPFTVVKLPPM